MAQKKGAVVRQAAFLMAAQLLCSVIGLLYRSPLHLTMGDIGDGYYTYAYEWYTIILLISSYSIPTAISKVMAERLAVGQYRNAQRVFAASIYYVIAVGGLGALIAFFGAPLFLRKQPDAVLALRVLAPTILLSGLLGCLRGYFQAHNTMTATAISRVAEQIVNAVVSVLAAYLFTRPYVGDELMVGKYGAAGGTTGTGAGVIAGILFMLFIYAVNARAIKRKIKRDRTKREESYRDVFRVIILMVTPIIFATFIYNASAIVDQNIYTYLMDAKGVSPADAARQYALFGYRFKPLINIPIALSSATSTALIPAVATAVAQRDMDAVNERINECMRLSMFLAVPAAVGMGVLSYPVIRILYPTGDVAGAAVLLSIGAVSVVFYSVSTVTNGVLQGLGKPSLPVIHAAIALAVNAFTAIMLVYFTDLGVKGILIATIVYSLTVMLLNARSLIKLTGYKHDLERLLLYPLMSASVMGAVVAVMYWVPFRFLRGLFARYIVSAIWTMVCVLIGVVIYFVIYTRSTGMTDEELRRMPMGTRVLSLLRLLHLR